MSKVSSYSPTGQTENNDTDIMHYAQVKQG